MRGEKCEAYRTSAVVPCSMFMHDQNRCNVHGAGYRFQSPSFFKWTIYDIGYCILHLQRLSYLVADGTYAPTKQTSRTINLQVSLNGPYMTSGTAYYIRKDYPIKYRLFTWWLMVLVPQQSKHIHVYTRNTFILACCHSLRDEFGC